MINSIEMIGFSLWLCYMQSYVVYFGTHSHGPFATSADYEKVKTTHYGFLASCLGRLGTPMKSSTLFSYEFYFQQRSYYKLYVIFMTVRKRQKMQYCTHTQDISMVFLQFLMRKKQLN